LKKNLYPSLREEKGKKKMTKNTYNVPCKKEERGGGVFFFLPSRGGEGDTGESRGERKLLRRGGFRVSVFPGREKGKRGKRPGSYPQEGGGEFTEKERGEVSTTESSPFVGREEKKRDGQKKKGKRHRRGRTRPRKKKKRKAASLAGERGNSPREKKKRTPNTFPRTSKKKEQRPTKKGRKYFPYHTLTRGREKTLTGRRKMRYLIGGKGGKIDLPAFFSW